MEECMERPAFFIHPRVIFLNSEEFYQREQEVGNMRKGSIVFVCVALVMLSTAASGGMWWQRGDPGSTWQDWQFMSDDNPAVPEASYNPYGNPTATVAVQGVTHGFNPGWYDTFWGRPGVWVGEETTVTLFIPNSWEPNPYKEIWLEMVFWGDLLPDTGIIAPPGAQLISETLDATQDNWRIWNVG